MYIGVSSFVTDFPFYDSIIISDSAYHYNI